MNLGPAQQRTRRIFDWRVLSGLRSPHLGGIRAFASEAARRRGREATPAEAERGDATIFTVLYQFDVLTGPGPTTPGATVAFDLDAGGNYPFAPPTVQVVSVPRAWGPHIHESTGSVCIGGGWAAAQGQMLLAQLAVHVMRLLNLDEPTPRDGFNSAAFAYWGGVLGWRPLHADFEYPLVSTELTHETETGVSAAEGVNTNGFRPLASSATGHVTGPVVTAFRPVGVGR